MCQAFALMTERAVSAIDKRTDSEIKSTQACGHSLPRVDHFTLCFVNERGAGGDVQFAYTNTTHEESIMQQRKN